MQIVNHPCPVTRVTAGPYHHFFGYYDKTPWDATGRYLLALRAAFNERPPTPADIVQIGMIDTEAGNRWHPLAESAVWCWQQGNMLQWLPADPRQSIIFNTADERGFAAQILNIESGESRLLPRPIYAPSPAGKLAATLDFARLERCRPGYGYMGYAEEGAGGEASEDNGIWMLELASGESRLIVSLAQLAATVPAASMQRVDHWVNHLQWNRSGGRLAFLHRWQGPGGFWTRLFTVDPDGSNLTLLEESGMVSHYDWRGDEDILAWSLHDGEAHFHLYRDRGHEVEVYAADSLAEDGHDSFSPDRRWLLTDTYPTRNERLLMLYQPETNTRYDIGRFYSDPAISGAIRCDLHPRWNRDGTLVCIDSIHEGTRQMYTLDVSSIVRCRRDFSGETKAVSAT